MSGEREAAGGEGSPGRQPGAPSRRSVLPCGSDRAEVLTRCQRLRLVVDEVVDLHLAGDDLDLRLVAFIEREPVGPLDRRAHVTAVRTSLASRLGHPQVA